MPSKPGRPRLDGDDKGVRINLVVPGWVRDELVRSGGISTTAREVLTRWAAKEGDDADARQQAEVLAVTAERDRAIVELERLRSAVGAAAVVAGWLPR